MLLLGALFGAVPGELVQGLISRVLTQPSHPGVGELKLPLKRMGVSSSFVSITPVLS